MGCGASHPADPLGDPQAPLATRDPSSSSAAPVIVTPKAASDDDTPPNPSPNSTRKSSLPSTLPDLPPPPSEPRTSDVTPLPTHHRHVSRAENDDDDDSSTTKTKRPRSATARISPNKPIDEEKTADDDEPSSPHDVAPTPTAKGGSSCTLPQSLLLH